MPCTRTRLNVVSEPTVRGNVLRQNLTGSASRYKAPSQQQSNIKMNPSPAFALALENDAME